MDLMISQPQRDLSKSVRLPVIYEEAVRDLIACQSLDEAKYFADKAEALAAWAKIHKDDLAVREAAALKLWAFKRMGELSKELRPDRFIRVPGPKGSRGKAPGCVSLLVENGLTNHESQAARKLALMSPEKFQSLVDLPRPPNPTSLRATAASSQEWLAAKLAIGALLSITRRLDAAKLPPTMTNGEKEWARQSTLEIQEWLDEFERFLPKENRS